MVAEVPSEETLDEVLVYLSRYSRTPIPYFEALPVDRVIALHKACSRLIAAENGKKPSLDLQAASEETR